MFWTNKAALHFTSLAAQGGLLSMSACSTAGSCGIAGILNCSFSHAWIADERKVMNVRVGRAECRLLKKARGIFRSNNRHRRCAIHLRDQIRRGCRPGARIQHLQIEIARLSQGQACSQLVRRC